MLITNAQVSRLLNLVSPGTSLQPNDFKGDEHTQVEVRDPRQVLARPTWVADRGVRCDRQQWFGKNFGRAFRLANGNFSLFGLANTHISVCSVWTIPIFRSVRSGQYPNFRLFGLANTQISVCSVWPIPKFWSVRSGQ